jgi:tetratricopeptide (TPR) repeat protein
MDRHFEHALVLLEQHRYDLAEEKLRQALLAEPEYGFAHALLAHCLCEREQWQEATSEAQQAVHLDPELAEAHAALARVWHERNHLDKARQAIDEALRLDPGHADYFQRLAAIHLSARDWQSALEAAEMGLATDPEHVGCTNLRAMALVKLGRSDDASSAIASALARAPEDAFSHANQGWALLHEGKRQQALEHFREALRLEPQMEFARAGIVEAMKSKNFLYALMLRYFLFMARLSGTAQWLIILGGYFGYRALGQLAANHPEWRPWVTPILIAYVAFAVMTWIAAPLFNLLLRLDRFGRHALSRDQVVASNWIGCFLAGALVSAVLWLWTDTDFAFLGMFLFGFLLLPLSATFACSPGWPRRMMALYTLALAGAGIGWLPIGLFNRDAGMLLLQVFLWGSVLSGFVANVLVMQTVRR